MIKSIYFFSLILLLTIAVSYFVDNSGGVEINWLNYQISTSITTFLFLLFLIILFTHFASRIYLRSCDFFIKIKQKLIKKNDQ
jgi:uncharacterized protein HemY